MKYKSVTITFDTGEPVVFDGVDELAISVNGFLAVYEGDKRHFYNFDNIVSYNFVEVEAQDGPKESNIHLIQ